MSYSVVPGVVNDIWKTLETHFSRKCNTYGKNRVEVGNLRDEAVVEVCLLTAIQQKWKQYSYITALSVEVSVIRRKYKRKRCLTFHWYFLNKGRVKGLTYCLVLEKYRVQFFLLFFISFFLCLVIFLFHRLSILSTPLFFFYFVIFSSLFIIFSS